jgi:lysophospholipase L1-like esterase
VRLLGLGLFWAFAGTLAWVAGAYAQNLAWPFYLGLALLIFLLVITQIALRLPTLSIQTFNTAILVIVGLPCVDFFYRSPAELNTRPDVTRAFYSYEGARRDPAAFGRWWRYYMDQWDLMAKDVFAPDPAGVMPVYLRPDSQGHLFESEVVINSLGFRGKEFPREKGNAYRIVALGESTTFGCTLNQDDKPWPELLESMINTRLRLTRRVEVINAGVPACTLKDNVQRIPRDILPLRPDLLISYHGINGFRMLDAALPSLADKSPPVHRQRPLKILADCEYRLKVLVYRHRQSARLLHRRAPDADLMNSEYAETYRQLVHLVRSNNVHLALANFCMAVNPRAQPAL